MEFISLLFIYFTIINILFLNLHYTQFLIVTLTLYYFLKKSTELKNKSCEKHEKGKFAYW